MAEYQKRCPECKKEFTAKRKDKTFCSTKCRIYYHRHEKEELKQCLFCKEYYIRKNRDKELKNYCSKECKEKARKENVRIAVRRYYEKNKHLIRQPSIGTTLQGIEKSVWTKKKYQEKELTNEEIKKLEIEEARIIRKIKEHTLKYGY